MMLVHFYHNNTRHLEGARTECFYLELDVKEHIYSETHVKDVILYQLSFEGFVFLVPDIFSVVDIE